MDDLPANRGRAALRTGRRPRPFRRGRHLITAGTPGEEVLLLESVLVKVVLPTVEAREPITGPLRTGRLWYRLPAPDRPGHFIANADGMN